MTTPHIGRVLSGLCHRVAHSLTEGNLGNEEEHVDITPTVEHDGRGRTESGDTHICTVPCGVWEASLKVYQETQVNGFTEALLWLY